MSSAEKAMNVSTDRCWEPSRRPSLELLAALKAGPFAEAVSRGQAALESLILQLRREKLTHPAVFIGAGTCGLGAGAAKVLEAVRTYCSDRKVQADIVEVGCIGLCSEEPILDVQIPGRARVSFGNLTPEKVPALLDGVFSGQIDKSLVLGQFYSDTLQPWTGVPFLEDYPFLAIQRRVVLAGSGLIDPASMDEYIAHGGYSAMAHALKTMTRPELCDLVDKSGLRGRGGGGFPTGRKWKMALQAVADQKYLVCYADEGDPGAFMDRAVGESDPHRLIEGMIIAAYAIGATKAYIYIRAEYPLAVRRLQQALEQVRACGIIGPNILGTGNELEIAIKMGAGAFVCGEETALIHSIEGKRGMPRPRPPFPVASGLFGKPTVINNVETLANLPLILERGPDWFSAMGTKGSKGTKVFAISGKVRRTGLVEIPMGTTLRQIVFDCGGGTPGGKKCKAVQIGGPSGGCVPEAHLDIPTDYEALKEFGAIMGSGGLVVLDETTCMVDLAKFFMEFIQNESCGKCIPCREGTRRMLEILQALCRPRHREDGLDALLRFHGVMHLEELAELIKATSLCGLGQTAPNPVLSTLRWFRDEYEAHVFDRRCPAGACKELVGAPCQNGCPAGTEAWRYVAHVARGEYEDAYRVLRQANPLPSTCSRVCHHPCEASCRAGATGGEPIAIRTLKRFIVDRVDPKVYAPAAPLPDARSARIAVIGAGPAGLAAAHELSLLGHRVTVFERETKPGGMLVCAIPSYRLPRERLEKEIASLLNQNIELRYGVELGKDVNIDGLLAEGYKAVYLALGAHGSRALDLPGEESEGIVPGMRFLKEFNLHGRELARGKVGVIGGGNSAMDAARVAFRQSGVESVTVFYRRTREEMPAYTEETEAALAEGIRIETLVAPIAVVSEGGRLKAMRFIRNELGEPDASGRRRPVPLPGSQFDAPLDTLIVAISEQPEPTALACLKSIDGGGPRVDPETFATAQPAVFAGGDLVTGPNTVIDAIAAGKRAAAVIDRYVRGRLLKTVNRIAMPSAYVEPVSVPDEDDLDSAHRVTPPELPLDQRRRCFHEVEMCISESQALSEARRCLRCDLEFTHPT